VFSPTASLRSTNISTGAILLRELNLRIYEPLIPNLYCDTQISQFTYIETYIMAQKTTLKEFESVYPKLEAALLEHAASYKLPEKEAQWFKKV
jgi:hypothetical protein